MDVGSICNMVSDPSTGAISAFIGTTRNEFEGKKVLRLDYEAYTPMAEKKMVQLCDEIRSKWPTKIHNIAIHHRLGKVDPTEASVVIAITSAHRKESLDAVQYAIDKLKATVPIWKKEVYTEGVEAKWKENKECFWSSSSKQSIQSGKDQGSDERNSVNDSSLKVVDHQCNIDPKYVQITASNDEIERRIEAFIERKREEINTHNVLEFCSRHLVNDEPNEFSCARTDSTGLIRKKNSSSHLRKSYVDNSKIGNDVKGRELSSDKIANLPFGLEERFINLEEHLSLKPIQRELYIRLKDIEDRVLYLEGLSPEYFEGTGNDSQPKKLSSAENVAGSEDKINTAENIELPVTDPSTDLVENETLKLQNMEYKQALSDSLCSINKRIQELQSKLKTTKVPIQ